MKYLIAIVMKGCGGCQAFENVLAPLEKEVIKNFKIVKIYRDSKEYLLLQKNFKVRFFPTIFMCDDYDLNNGTFQNIVPYNFILPSMEHNGTDFNSFERWIFMKNEVKPKSIISKEKSCPKISLATKTSRRK